VAIFLGTKMVTYMVAFCWSLKFFQRIEFWKFGVEKVNPLVPVLTNLREAELGKV
jgi:hypothetical protein